MRRKFGLEQDGELIAETTDQGILLRPAVSMPVELYSVARIAESAEQDGLSKQRFPHLSVALFPEGGEFGEAFGL